MLKSSRHSQTYTVGGLKLREPICFQMLLQDKRSFPPEHRQTSLCMMEMSGRGTSLIRWRGGTEPRRHHRTGSRGVTAQREAAGRESRGRAPCEAGVGEVGEAGGGERWGEQSCS